MKESVYNLEVQNKSIENKIVFGLERVTEAFRVMLWEKAKEYKLSPIQIQILIFINNHDNRLCTVSYLANEYNMTKATISDSVKSLLQKELIVKLIDEDDSRSYRIGLTAKGNDLALQLTDYSDTMLNPIKSLSIDNKSFLWEIISKLIRDLQRSGAISMQRMCYTCSYYSEKDNSAFCNLLNQQLHTTDIRLDCPEHKSS